MRRHDLDLTSLVAGLVFVALAGIYLVGELTDVHIGWRWVLPLMLIGLGVAGLAGSIRSGLRPAPAPGDETDQGLPPDEDAF